MKSKPFTDGEFIKHCLSFVSDILCPNVSLSARTVTRRIEDSQRNIASKFVFFSIVLDKCTDMTDIAQLEC